MTDTHIKIDDAQPMARYTGDGVATEFAAPFAFIDAADLKVWIGTSLQVLQQDFSVTGAGDSQGGAVHFTSPPASGSAVVVARQQTISRTSDFLAGSALSAAALNTELDRLTMAGQELAAADGRALRAAPHDIDALPALPDAADRAGRLLSFDQDGNPEAGPARAIVDLVDQVVGAEAGAVAAATSAEAAAAVVAQQVAAVDMDEIRDSHAAAIARTVGEPPVSFPGVPMLAHIRPPRIFAPVADTLRHQYRPQDSGVWLYNSSGSKRLWVDARMLGIGQELKLAVRAVTSGGGDAVIDPGMDQLGNPNTIRPFAAGEKLRIHAGESVVLTASSVDGDGGVILDIVHYEARPRVVLDGTKARLVENSLGLYDGESFENAVTGLSVLDLPLGFKTATDSGMSRFSFPLFQGIMTSDGDVAVPRIKLPDREYNIGAITGGPFQNGELVTVEDSSGTPRASSLRVEYLTDDPAPIGLDLLATPVPVATDQIIGVTSGARASVLAVTPISVLPGNVTSLTIHNPNAGTIDLRVAWRNLEKI